MKGVNKEASLRREGEKKKCYARREERKGRNVKSKIRSIFKKNRRKNRSQDSIEKT